MITCDFNTYREAFLEAVVRNSALRDIRGRFASRALSMIADYFGAVFAKVPVPASSAEPTFDFVLFHNETVSLFILDEGFPRRSGSEFGPEDLMNASEVLRRFVEKSASEPFEPVGTADSEFSLVRQIIRKLAEDQPLDDVRAVELFVFTPVRPRRTVPPAELRYGGLRTILRVFPLSELWEEGIGISGMENRLQCLPENLPALSAQTVLSLISEGLAYPVSREGASPAPAENGNTAKSASANAAVSPEAVRKEPETDFSEYYDRFIDRIDVKTEKNPYRSAVSAMLSDFYRLKVITPAPDEDGLLKAFDCFFVTDDMLCLCILDRHYDDREDEIITLADTHNVIRPLLDFARRAAESSDPVPAGSKSLRHRAVNIIRDLARGKIAEGGIRYVKLYAFTPCAPDPKVAEDGLRMQESLFTLGQTKCRARVISLKEMWARSIEIPPASKKAGKPARTPALAPAPKPEVAAKPENANGPKKPAREKSTKPPAASKATTPPAVVKPGDAEPTDAESFRQYLLIKAKEDSDFQHNAFFRLCTEILCDADLFEEIRPAFAHLRDTDAGEILFDGWALDEQNNVLSVFVLDLAEDRDGPTVSKAETDRYFGCLENFVSGSLNESLYDDVFDPRTDAGELAGIAQTGLCGGPGAENAFSRLRLIIVSSRTAAAGTASKQSVISGFRCDREIIDINELWKLSREDKELVVDFRQPRFGGGPLHVIAAVDDRTSGYRSYVGKIPGPVLAEIYREYGQRVLSSNVRAFLSVTQSVNKGIQKTIREEPHKFFAYNNGICAVASSVDSFDRQGLVDIMSATDFQVVNGGQTTASLYHALRAGISLDKIAVQLKLSVVPRNADIIERDEFIQNISKFANSQNQVTASDLGTNTIFQIAFHKLCDSPSCTVPAGTGQELGWFYERMRASYRNELSKRETASQKKAFRSRYPKGTLFTKTDLGKWFMSWYCHPHITSLGAQKCYTKFVAAIQKPSEEHDPKMTFVTPAFFRSAVARGILFLHVDNLIGSRPWYLAQRGYKANLTAYTVALLTKAVEYNFGPDMTIDLERIWQNQLLWYDPEHRNTCREISIFDELADRIARGVKSVFEDEPRDTHDVGEWVKKDKCWLAAQKIQLDISPSAEQFRRFFCCRKNPAWDFPVIDSSVLDPNRKGRKGSS